MRCSNAPLLRRFPQKEKKNGERNKYSLNISKERVFIEILYRVSFTRYRSASIPTFIFLYVHFLRKYSMKSSFSTHAPMVSSKRSTPNPRNTLDTFPRSSCFLSCVIISIIVHNWFVFPRCFRRCRPSVGFVESKSITQCRIDRYKRCARSKGERCVPLPFRLHPNSSESAKGSVK